MKTVLTFAAMSLWSVSSTATNNLHEQSDTTWTTVMDEEPWTINATQMQEFRRFRSASDSVDSYYVDGIRYDEFYNEGRDSSAVLVTDENEEITSYKIVYYTTD